MANSCFSRCIKSVFMQGTALARFGVARYDKSPFDSLKGMLKRLWVVIIRGDAFGSDLGKTRQISSHKPKPHIPL